LENLPGGQERLMNKKVRKQQIAARTDAERTEGLRDVDPRIVDIGFHAVFAPRSIAGKYQWDPLMTVILYTMANLEKGIKTISFEEFITAFSKSLDGAPHPHLLLLRLEAQELMLRPGKVGQSHEGRLSVSFKALAERLEYLEIPPTQTAGDFAVDALQDAFMGLISSQYHWGKDGFPTKGKVTEMAKASLTESGRNVRKSGWTALLREAHLDWLPEGYAGRPSKADMDENAKASREAHSILTQAIQNVHNGDAIGVRDRLKAYYGGKAEYQRSEQDRLGSSSENETTEEALE
jgi:hypothetical protein